MVVNPPRSDAELFAAHGAVQDILIRERHLRHEHPDVEPAHDRNSNLPWLMVFTPRQVASNANDRTPMRYASTARSSPSGVGDAKRTATRATRPGSSTPTMPRTRWAHIAIVHSPWVNKKSKPLARAAAISKWCGDQSPDTSA